MRALSTLVTGVGGPAGRAVAAYLCERGFRVVGADMRPLSNAGRFCLLPPASDSEFISALQRIIEEEGISFLIPTVTEELPKVARARDLIRGKGCFVYVSSPRAVGIANDKWTTASALTALGVSVPRSYCGNSRQQLLESIPFPILSKPRVGRGGRGIEIHESTEALPMVLSPERIYQEFLSGEEYDVNVFARGNGDSPISVVLQKTVLQNGRVGNAAAVQRVDEREIAELAEDAVRALSLEGPVDIDIRRAANGHPAILEINARVGANVRSAEEVLNAMMDSWRNQS